MVFYREWQLNTYNFHNRFYLRVNTLHTHKHNHLVNFLYLRKIHPSGLISNTLINNRSTDFGYIFEIILTYADFSRFLISIGTYVINPLPWAPCGHNGSLTERSEKLNYTKRYFYVILSEFLKNYKRQFLLF